MPSLTGGILSPTLVAYLVAAIDLFGGILILVGYQTRLAAVVLIVFVILTMVMVHSFWTMEGPARAANQVNFYKNLAIIGALFRPHCRWAGTPFAGRSRGEVTSVRELW